MSKNPALEEAEKAVPGVSVLVDGFTVSYAFDVFQGGAKIFLLLAPWNPSLRSACIRISSAQSSRLDGDCVTPD